MRILSKRFRAMLILLIITVLTATLQAEEVENKTMSPWTLSGQVIKVGPHTLQFLGRSEGVLYIEDRKGDLDGSAIVCAITKEINTTNSKTVYNGRCMITAGDEGDSIFANLSCNGDLDSCRGTFKITGGEGQFKGIQGASKLLIRTKLGEMAVDPESNNLIRNAEGLAFFPNLKYTIPSN
jgi:hypothetical protein